LGITLNSFYLIFLRQKIMRNFKRHLWISAGVAGLLLNVGSSRVAAQVTTSQTTPSESTSTVAKPKTGPARWETAIAAFERADKKAMPPADAYLFIGSSSIGQWSKLDGDFAHVPVINRGFGGSQVEDSVYFAPRIVWPYKPKMVLLYAGDNDIAAGKTPARVLQDVQAFVAKVREGLPQTPIAFIAIKPSPSREALMPKAAEANRMVQQWIEAQNAQGGHARLTYIDVWTPMLNAQGKPRAELFGRDRLHMNSTGYALWTQIVAPYLK
jgi:lysophospholipase L1-like esterase